MDEENSRTDYDITQEFWEQNKKLPLSVPGLIFHVRMLYGVPRLLVELTEEHPQQRLRENFDAIEAWQQHVLRERGPVDSGGYVVFSERVYRWNKWEKVSHAKIAKKLNGSVIRELHRYLDYEEAFRQKSHELKTLDDYFKWQVEVGETGPHGDGLWNVRCMLIAWGISRGSGNKWIPDTYRVEPGYADKLNRILDALRKNQEIDKELLPVTEGYIRGVIRQWKAKRQQKGW